MLDSIEGEVRKEKATQRPQLGGELGGILASMVSPHSPHQGAAERARWGRRNMGHLVPLGTLFCSTLWDPGLPRGCLRAVMLPRRERPISAETHGSTMASGDSRLMPP